MKNLQLNSGSMLNKKHLERTKTLEKYQSELENYKVFKSSNLKTSLEVSEDKLEFEYYHKKL